MPEDKSNNVLEDKLKLKKVFDVPSYDEWKKIAEESLKGAPFEKKLVTKTYEGIDLQPIYTRDDIKDNPFLESFPGFKNYVRGTEEEGYVTKDWDIAQDLPFALAEEFNEALRYDLERGQNSIKMLLDKATKKGLDSDYAEVGEVGNSGLAISALNSIGRAFNGIDITKYPVHIEAGFSGLPLAILLAAYFKKENIDVSKVKGSLKVDPFAYAVTEGELQVSFETVFDEMKALIDWKKDNNVGLDVIGVSGVPYHNAGASAVQELAFAMSTAVEYITQMQNRGVDAKDAVNNITFNFGVGSFYFMEIAKLRAARIMWNQIAEAYGLDKDKAKIKIHAVTSGYNQTVYDPYVNMLRTTTEAFSAVVGGVESLTTNHFDQVYGMPDNFSRRISRNTQIILNEEAHLNKLIDPAGGSYFVENLTKNVAEKAWELFKEMENNGGMLKALQDEHPHSEIEKVVESRKKDARKRKSVIVGTNMFANLKEEKLPDKEKDFEGIFKRRKEYLQKYRVSGNNEKHNSILQKLQKLVDSQSGAELFQTGVEAALEGATIGEITKSLRAQSSGQEAVKKINIHRILELFEELRERSAKYENKFGKKPTVFLAAIGGVNQHKARADFSRGFFEVGGFEVVYEGPKGFDNPEEAAKAAIENDAHVVVVCSTDDTYPELVPDVVKEVRQRKGNMLMVLAGYPKEQIEEHKKNGIDEFIYLGADAYAILENLLKKIGA